MPDFYKDDIKRLFKFLCCSVCKNDFDETSLLVNSKEGDVYKCRLICQKCGKDFGDIILKYYKNLKIHNSLEVIDGPAPIDIDDVIDAHNFIKHMK